MGKKRRGEDQRRSDSEIRHRFIHNGSSSSRMCPDEIPHQASLESILQQIAHLLSTSTDILREMKDKDDKFRKTEDKVVHIEEKYENKFKEMEEKYEKKFKEMEEKNEKKFKEMEEELEKQNNGCKVMKEELEELKDNAYSSTAERTQPDQSQQARLNLKILSRVNEINYKGKIVRTDTMNCVQVQLCAGDSPITHDHHLLSAKVELVILKEEFNKGAEDYWSKEDFMQGLKRLGEGNTPMQIKNSTFKLTAGYASHAEAIILDNSNRKAVRLGVKILGHPSERVLEGISNPFRVQEAKTEPKKDGITTDNSQQQQAPMNNRSQPTNARSASENGDILSANCQQQSSGPVPKNNSSHRTTAQPASENDEFFAANSQQQQVPMNNRSQHTIAQPASENGYFFVDNHQQQSYQTDPMNNWQLLTIARSAEHGQGMQSLRLETEINSVQPSLYQLTGNGQIVSGDYRQISTSHTAVAHTDSLNPPPFTPGQGAAGCYQRSFQQSFMDTSHDTAITHNGRAEYLQTSQDFDQPHNMSVPTICVDNGLCRMPGFQTLSTSQQDSQRAEYTGGLYPQTQNQGIPNLQLGNGGPFILNRVQLLWDEPDVKPRQCWNILDKLMPLFPDMRLVHEYDRLLASDYFLKTSMRVHGSMGIAKRGMQRPHNRGVLIQSLEDSDSEHEPPLKTKWQPSYQLQFVNKSCREYYVGEQIKAEDGGLLKVALYNEDILRIRSGPLSSASVEIVLLHGDFNADCQYNWAPEEFGNYILCPLSEEEPPALGGDCVLTLVDGEASLSSASFQKTSSFARTGKFTMGVKMKTILEERVQEGITQPFLVQVRQDEGSNYTCEPSDLAGGLTNLSKEVCTSLDRDSFMRRRAGSFFTAQDKLTRLGNICTSAAKLLTSGVQPSGAASGHQQREVTANRFSAKAAEKMIKVVNVAWLFLVEAPKKIKEGCKNYLRGVAPELDKKPLGLLIRLLSSVTMPFVIVPYLCFGADDEFAAQLCRSSVYYNAMAFPLSLCAVILPLNMKFFGKKIMPELRLVLMNVFYLLAVYVTGFSVAKVRPMNLMVIFLLWFLLSLLLVLLLLPLKLWLYPEWSTSRKSENETLAPTPHGGIPYWIAHIER